MVAAKRYLKHGLLAGLAAGAVVAGCSPVATGSPGDLAVAKSAEPPAMTASVAPPGVTIWNEEASQAEVVLPSGRRIYIDVGQPALLTVQPKATDVLLVSQQRPHHFDPNFARGFPGQKIVGQSGRLDLGDAVVRTVESSENDSPYEPGQGTNQILVIEAAGRRILHCGDLDQSALTAGQLTNLAASTWRSARFSIRAAPPIRPGSRRSTRSGKCGRRS